MRTRKGRFILICTAAMMVLAAVVILVFFVLPSAIQPVGTGVPAITSQFSAIKTRAKTPTSEARAEHQSNGGIQAARFVAAEAPVRRQQIFEACTAVRKVTATPTGQAVPTLTITPTMEAGETANAEADFVVLRVVSAESEACYQVGEVFLDEGNRFEVAVGVTKAINGEIAINRANVSNSQIGEFVIDISQLRSDRSNRDGAIRQEWLESNRFPLAKLISAQMVGLPSGAYRDGEVLHFQIVAVLEIRGVQNTITFHTSAVLSGMQLTATAYADIRMTDFGFDPPSLLGLSVNDEMRIVLNLVAREPDVTPPPTALPTTTVACRPTTTRAEPPFASPEPPIRDSVDKGHVLSGVVRSSEGCAPIAGAKIIFWLANPSGEYDDAHTATVITDAEGKYRFESNYPGSYDNVRPHIHMYVSAEGYQSILTEHLPRAGQTEGVFDIVLVPES
jgi:hypothetical protein